MKVTTDEVRRTVRTVLAVTATLAALVPVLVELGVVDSTRWPWLASVVVVAGIITRAMANPTVDGVLRDLGVGRDSKVIPGEVVDAAPPPVDVPQQDPGAAGDL